MTRRQESPAAADNRAEIAVYVSKIRAIGFALLAAVLIASCVICLWLGLTIWRGADGSVDVRLLAFVFLPPLLLLGTVRLLASAFSSTPRLVVNHEGVWVDSPFVFGTGIVSWSDMSGIQAVKFRVLPGNNQTYLVILLHDRRALRMRQNKAQAALYILTGYSVLWPKAVVAHANLLNMPVAELLERIRVQYGPELARHEIATRVDLT
jgi:hypothetical protein